MSSAEDRVGRHLTDAEALMWTLDDEPALRSSFMGITFLDRPLDPERFRLRMVDAVGAVAALRHRVVPTPLDLAPPRWDLDPDFDIDRHVHHAVLPPPGDRRQLLDLAADLYAQPFDRARPLWQFTVVDGLADGGCALLAKMHHVLSDGIGAVRVSVSFLDLSPDGDESTRDQTATAPEATADAAPAAAGAAAALVSGPRGWFDAAAGALAPIVTANAELTRKGAAAVAGTISTVVRSPAGGVTIGLSTARSLGRQLGLTDPARSPLWAARSYSHRFDTLSIDLDRLRAAAKALGGTVNDAFVTIMAAAAGDYHRAAGFDVDELRMTMPISVRHDREVAGNAWVPTRLLVPTGPLAPTDRFAEVAARLNLIKTEPALGLANAFAGVVRLLPRPVLVRLARQQVRTVDFACSNVRGAPFDLWIAGSHVESNHPMGPTAGVAFNATVLSYKTTLDLGLNTDTGAIADPDLLVRCVDGAASEFLALAQT